MQKIIIKNLRFTIILGCALLLLLLLPSCYSVRIVNINGSAIEDFDNEQKGYYKHKEVHIIDTVISLNLTQGEFMSLEACGSGGFHSVEYRVSLGQVLLSGITFGRKRKMKVIYTCLLDESEFE